MSLFATDETAVTQDRTALPSMITVHDPHCPKPQPNRGPRQSRSLRRTYSNGAEGSTSTFTAWPLTFRFTMLIGFSPGGIGGRRPNSEIWGQTPPATGVYLIY